MKVVKRIAILTGGGDCPGLNAVIRAVTKSAILDHGFEVVGVADGFEGLVRNRTRKLRYRDVSGILTLGGTILGTSNRANIYQYPVGAGRSERFADVSATVIRNLNRLRADCLVCVGGDGTLSIANRLFRQGIPVVGIPKTIDNDINGTEITFGFDTAVQVCTEAVDRLHSTAQSHHRVMIVEVMGRNAGWIALHAGIAGGGDVILLPEMPYSLDAIARVVAARNRKGKRFSIVVVSEGAKPRGGEVVVARRVRDGAEPVRLGGVGFVLGKQLEDLTGIETRAVVLGHLQRGGTPSPFDRVLGTRLGTQAVEYISRRKFGVMVGVRGAELVPVPLRICGQGQRLVPRRHPLIRTARAIGTSFGT